MIRRSEARSAGQPLVELRHLSKRFTMHTEAQRSIQDAFVNLLRGKRDHGRTFWPIKDVSLTVNPGDSVGVIGTNGSGKSTLLKLITGILEPTSGDIIVNGRVSSLLELGAGFHGDLTGRENIFLNGAIFGLSRRVMRQRIDSIIDFAELGDFIDVPVKHYSSGMYIRLGFAVAIHTDPDLLLVDEVLAVGDTSFQHKCMDAIQEFRTRGGTILLVSHDLGSIQSLCKQAVWLDHGTVLAQGSPTDVTMSYLNSVAQREEEAAKQPSKLPRHDRRWGSGRIQITDVRLYDADGDQCTTFVDGSPMRVRMRYRALERVEDPIFGIAIHHQNGAHVTGPNTRFGQYNIPFVEGEGEVVYEIPALPLLEGGYVLTVAATNGDDTELFDYHDRLYPFRVYPGKSNERYGLVTLSGNWRVEPGERYEGEKLSAGQQTGIYSAKTNGR